MAVRAPSIRAIGIYLTILGGGLLWAGIQPARVPTPPVFAYYVAHYMTPTVSRTWSGWFEVISPREIAAYEKTPEGRGFLEQFLARPDLRRSLKWYLPEDLSGIAETEETRSLVTSALTPFRQPYDSSDVQLIKAHLAEASESGVSGFIVNWEGKGTHSDRAAHQLLNNAPENFSIVLLYSFVPADGDTFQSDLLYLRQKFFTHHNYWKVRDDPVVILSASTTAALPPTEWIDILRASSRTVRFALFGDTANPTGYADLFDGMIVTDLSGFVSNPAAFRRAYRNDVLTFRSVGRQVCLPVHPGYLRYRSGRVLVPFVDRDLKRFSEDLAAALALQPDCVVVFSYNDWRSGTAVEPSREEGDAYLKTLRDTLLPAETLPAKP
jgi:hypothetical protein